MKGLFQACAALLLAWPVNLHAEDFAAERVPVLPPGDMPENLVKELADYVRKAQPGALLCSRIGHDMGDYASKGDMEVPPRNADGLWESCDTSNDSWSYAWYDQNWKDRREILFRVVSTVARGGTYLYNIGPDGRGRVPAPAAKYLLKAGEWLKRYPQVVYGAGASPWGHALPWGDVTTQGNTLNLAVFDWPQDGRLFLPGLQSKIKSAAVITAGKPVPVKWEPRGPWTELQNQQNSASVYHYLSVRTVVISPRPGSTRSPFRSLRGSPLKASLSAVHIESDGIKPDRIG